MTFFLPRTEILEAVRRELASRPIVLLTGPRGAGKSFLLRRLVGDRGFGPAALVQVEAVSCSPEVLQGEIGCEALEILGAALSGASPFESLLARLRGRRRDSLLLLDDVTEIRTLSYYPSVEQPLERFLEAVSAAGKSVLTSRFSYWMRWKFPALPAIGLPPISARELAGAGVPEPELVASASGGLAVHAIRLAGALAAGASSTETALASEISEGGRIESECRATMSELLHKARGYNACKSVLRVLAKEEGLKLAEVARRLDRTAGSTRDYLRWLEEVDLVEAREKRFFFVDPLLRLWVRIYGRARPPGDDEVRRECASYLESLAPAALPKESEYTLPPPPSGDLVEID